MKKAILVCVALLSLAASAVAQEWVVSSASEGLKGPVRSVHWVKVDSSTCKWRGCTLVPPTFIESWHIVFADDGLLSEEFYNNRQGSAVLITRHYDKKRRLKKIVRLEPTGNVRFDYHYDGRRVQTYTVCWNSDTAYHDSDTATFRCHYDKSNNLLSVTEEDVEACPHVDYYENGYRVLRKTGDWHVVYVRNPQGLLLKDSTYLTESGFDEHGEWKCWPGDTAIETNEYFYTPDGDLAEVRKVEYGRKHVTTFRYLEYDAFGNWTRRKKTYTKSDGTTEITDEIRMISYRTSKP